MTTIDGDIDLEIGSITSLSSSSSETSSVNTSNGAGPALPRPKPIGMRIRDSVVKEFVEEYGIQPIQAMSHPFHPHPHLAFQRNTLELIALKLAVKLGKTCDVGSAARTARRHSDAVHCMVPTIQPGDIARLQEVRATRASFCEHRLQQCNCGPFATLLFVHSAYYFTYLELKQALSKTTRKLAFVVGHTFDEGYGHMAFLEGVYELRPVGEEMMVVMSARGNAQTYTHMPLLWDFGRTPGDADSHLAVELLHSMGDTKLWRVTLMEGPAPEICVSSFKDMVVDRKHVGPITIPGHDAITKMSTASNQLVPVEVDRLYGFGPVLWTHTSRGHVVVPRGIICEAALMILYRERTPATFADTVHRVKTATSNARLPSELKLLAATVAVVIAFNCNVQAEIEYVNTASTRFTWLWKLHATAVTLTPLRIVTLTTIVVWGVITLLIAVALWLAVPLDHHVVGWIGLLVWLTVVLLLLSVMCLARRQQISSARYWGDSLYHEGRTANITGLVNHQVRRTYRANDSLREPLLPVPESARFEIGVDPNPPRRPGVTPEILLLNGAAFSTAVPSVVRDCQEADIVAVTTRLLRPPTVVQRTAYDYFKDYKSNQAGVALSHIKITFNDDVDFNDWVSQPKFNEGTRRRFKAHYDKHKGTHPRPSIFRSFVKVEKNKTATVDGSPKLKPRMISGPWDAVKVMCGPQVAKIYTRVREVWNGLDCPVLYASGMTPDAIGARCDDFARKMGGWDNLIGVWADCTAYDSTLQNELLSVRELYPQFGMSKLAYAWLLSPRNAGVSKHGVKYSGGKKMAINEVGVEEEVELRTLYSGEMDTNLVGSIVNGLASSSALHRIGVENGTSFQYLLLVCGDDSLILMSKDDWTPSLYEEYKNHLFELGLEPTIGASYNRGDWEFCSKLFWWGVHPVTKVRHTVLGPKPGRLLSRLGWGLSVPGSMNIRAALVSVAGDSAHVPLVNTLVRHLLGVTRGMKEKGKPEYSEIKHVSRVYTDCPENTMLLFGRYGLSAENVREFERVVMEVQSVPCVLNFPTIEGMVRRDEM